MQLDGSYSSLSPVVHGDIVLSINTSTTNATLLVDVVFCIFLPWCPFFFFLHVNIATIIPAAITKKMTREKTIPMIKPEFQPGTAEDKSKKT